MEGSSDADRLLLRRLEYDPADYAPANWQVARFAPFRMAYSVDLGVSYAAPVEPIDPSTSVVAPVHMLLNEARSAGCTRRSQDSEKRSDRMRPAAP